MGLGPKYREEFVEAITRFIADKVRDARAKGIVLGLSGGLDSAVIASLCARAIGPEKVLCILMPDTATPQQEMDDALELSKSLDIEHMVVQLDPVMEGFRKQLGGDVHPQAFGNVKARSRMCILYYHGQLRNYLVMGTGNKSEILMGYFTKHGDGGVDYQPIGDLYKTQVRGLAEDIGLPRKFIEKPPSANLMPGQTDEDDLGITYEDLDRILLGIELGMTDEDIAERAGTPVLEVARVRSVVLSTRHKRRIPLAPKLGIKTVGWDWRE